MPVSPTYPGVYIEEIPSGVHTITGVATSVTAFLGRTQFGPKDLARSVTSFADFERSFGGLDPAYPLSYAVYDFFAAGGSQAMVVRIFADVGASAGAAVAKAANDSTDTDPAKVAAAATTEAAKYTTEPAQSAAAAVAKAATDAATGTGGTPGTVAEVKKAALAKAAATSDTSTAQLAVSTNTVMKLKAVGPGAWGNDLVASFDTAGITDEVALQVGLDKNLLFNVDIYYNPKKLSTDDLKKRPADERVQNVSVWKEAGTRRIDRVLKQLSNLATYDGTFPIKADSTSDKAAKDLLDKLTAFAGGFNSQPLTHEAYRGSESEKTGMRALDDVDLFNLMCIPPDSRDGDTDTMMKSVFDDALTYCYSRRAMLIVDPPGAWKNRVALLDNPGAKLAELNLVGEKARNAFLYYPRVQMADVKRGGQIQTFPACGLIAGIFARTDTQRGVWVAPAGLDASLGGVTLEVNLTDRENGRLNPLGINCLRAFQVAGRVVWGARTMRGADQLADEYKYVPVRRTALYIEESLYRGTQWVVFKPNDEPLWGQIRLNVGAFMNDLFRKGAFQGSRPQDAYFVRCDRTTTTQNDIDHGVVNIVVGFAPLKPAEFVIVQLQQMAGQIQV